MSRQNQDLLRAAQLAVFIGISIVALFAAPAVLQLFPGGHTILAQQVKSDRLKAVLSQMDAASTKFKSAEANVKKEHFEKIVSDTSGQSGTIYFQRNGNSIQVGAKFDNGQVLEYKNGTVRLYSSGTNHLDQASAGGSNQARFETFLTLGFGGSGADLAKAWNITDQGTEQLNDGAKPVQVEKLDLVSKDPSVQKTFSHITIWVDPARGVSLKQEYFAPSGDTDTATYSNIRLNQPIDVKAYAIKCKGKCS
jgi:outer membrane lipoprotein-sorting protein